MFRSVVTRQRCLDGLGGSLAADIAKQGHLFRVVIPGHEGTKNGHPGRTGDVG